MQSPDLFNTLDYIFKRLKSLFGRNGFLMEGWWFSITHPILLEESIIRYPWTQFSSLNARTLLKAALGRKWGKDWSTADIITLLSPSPILWPMNFAIEQRLNIDFYLHCTAITSLCITKMHRISWNRIIPCQKQYLVKVIIKQFII